MDDVHRRLPRAIAALVVTALALPRADAGPIREGFDAAALPAAPTAPEPTVRFFGHTFDSLHLNAAGNVKFADPLPTFHPLPLGELRDANITAFFAGEDPVRRRGGGRVSAATGGDSAGTPAGGLDGPVQSAAQSPPAAAGAGGGNQGNGGSGGGGGGGGSPAWASGDFGGRLIPRYPTTHGADLSEDDPDPSATAGPGGPGIDPTGLALALLGSGAERPNVLVEGGGPAGQPDAPTGPSGTGGLPAAPGVLVSTPEPATMVLGLIGAAGLMVVRRRPAVVSAGA